MQISALFAQSLVRVSESNPSEYLGKRLQIFSDSSNKISFEKIKQCPELFTPASQDVPNLGITKNTHWLKFSVANDTDADKMFISVPNPIIDEISFFALTKNGVDSINYNIYNNLKTREYPHQYYIFSLDLPKGDTADIYLKIKSGQQILAPVQILKGKHILQEVSDSDLKSGIYLGIILVMFFYNLFLFFTVKERDYLVYCHYIFWVGLTQATLLGISHREIWPESTWLSQNMITICGAMSGIATILFAQSFLKIRTFSRKRNIFLNITIISYVISLMVLISGHKQIAFQIVNMTAAIVSLLIMYIAWYVFRQKYQPAKYFLISWSIFFVSILIFVAKDYGIVPYNSMTVHAVEIGSAMEAVLLSFALANKINIFKKEKEISQAAALAAAEENERIIKEQNVILEQKVLERTHELLETNEELSVTLEDLKQTQSQLVAAEKMASLGQLTAGIAHEINNPINFVTSNVAPLHRDVSSLLDTIDKIEKVALTEKSVPEKQQEIEDYKEELDYDYLKIEISHLLKGIQEGATRTAEIVKGLRIFSRVDEDDLKRADINEGIESTLVIMNSALVGAKIEVVRNLGDLPLVECYPGKLNQVFLNLISNAIHAIQKVHGDSGNGKLIITSTRKNEEEILIRFEDNGCGMSETTKAKIFDPFFTTKDVGEGTGLGMSIAYNTIKKHNGKIIVLSEINKGTQFNVEIPIYHQAQVS